MFDSCWETLFVFFWVWGDPSSGVASQHVVKVGGRLSERNGIVAQTLGAMDTWAIGPVNRGVGVGRGNMGH